ncbi:unnamed protein product [Urochloa humidicola]
MPNGHIGHDGHAVLTTAEGGVLGCVRLEGSRLHLWSREVGPHGDMEWAQSRVIEIRTLVPAGAFLYAFDVVGFADGGGVVYVGTYDASYVTDLKSGRVRKVERVNGRHKINPYISFFTPALSVAYTGEEPKAGA